MGRLSRRNASAVSLVEVSVPSTGKNILRVQAPSVMTLKGHKVFQFILCYIDTTAEAAPDEYFSSPCFTVGGHEWSLCYFPWGSTGSDGRSVSMYLRLSYPSSSIIAATSFTVLDHRGRPLDSTSNNMVQFNNCTLFGSPNLATRRMLAERCVDNAGRLVFICDLQVYEHARPSGVLSSLLAAEDLTDVSFLVEGETISAHRLVLAARSPVFRAKLYGCMAESNQRCIEISGIKAAIFRAMLRYIYTASFPEDQAADDTTLAGLLEAADIYGLEELKEMCEDRLSRGLTLDNVASAFKYSMQHSCRRLKAACLEFMVGDLEMCARVMLTPGYIELWHCCPDAIDEIRTRLTRGSSPRRLYVVDM